jgi:hypothetical protein
MSLNYFDQSFTHNRFSQKLSDTYGSCANAIYGVLGNEYAGGATATSIILRLDPRPELPRVHVRHVGIEDEDTGLKPALQQRKGRLARRDRDSVETCTVERRDHFWARVTRVVHDQYDMARMRRLHNECLHASTVAAPHPESTRRRRKDWHLEKYDA